MALRVSWLPRWLGAAFASLYSAYGDELFTFEQAAGAAARGNIKLILSLLRRKGWLVVFAREGRKRSYRLLRPDLAVLAFGQEASMIPKQGRYATLVACTLGALKRHYGGGLCSVAIFGSVARGTAALNSDLDMLVVADFRKTITGRIDELADLEYSGKVKQELDWLGSQRVQCHISWFPLTREEAARFRPLYLDMVEDAMIVYDRSSFLTHILGELRRRLKRQGAKRFWLDKDRWYWSLNREIGEEPLVAV